MPYKVIYYTFASATTFKEQCSPDHKRIFQQTQIKMPAKVLAQLSTVIIGKKNMC